MCPSGSVHPDILRDFVALSFYLVCYDRLNDCDVSQELINVCVAKRPLAVAVAGQ